MEQTPALLTVLQAEVTTALEAARVLLAATAAVEVAAQSVALPAEVGSAMVAAQLKQTLAVASPVASSLLDVHLRSTLTVREGEVHVERQVVV